MFAEEIRNRLLTVIDAIFGLFDASNTGTDFVYAFLDDDAELNFGFTEIWEFNELMRGLGLSILDKTFGFFLVYVDDMQMHILTVDGTRSFASGSYAVDDCPVQRFYMRFDEPGVQCYWLSAYHRWESCFFSTYYEAMYHVWENIVHKSMRWSFSSFDGRVNMSTIIEHELRDI